ncbi:LPS export ABC transporter periplasmic protein LptC [Reinekea thalattae]|uniref:LPS export ABC transporter periplasmic protein LptC n=1 Tax=Reinekea thalattae TaxID=2593301 RepID=A0A5C8Z1Y9_9GAMM|nr:LPS export ABC transporter periplasmic protein LptC [Reinekea thalattae]TXR52172.1 LPS export ABC transporter periplasmic protein LptC [Reinekea thalattae]
MPRLQRHHLLLATAIVVGAGFAWLAGKDKESTTDTAFELPEQTPNIYMTDMKLTRYNSAGEALVYIESTDVAIYQELGETLLNQPDITILNNDRNDWKITANRAVLYDNDDVEFFIDVTMVEQTERLATSIVSDYVKATQSGQWVETDLPVEIRQGNSRSNAIGMTADLSDANPIINLIDEVTFYYEPN